MKRTLLLLTVILLHTTIVLAQKVIRGRVTDDKGNPVAGASVTVKETQAGTSTDANGNYSLSVDANARTLVFSFIGAQSTELAIGANSTIDAVLRSQQTTMNEVVVVAYGSQQRRKITGSIGKLAGSEVENIPMSSVEQMLQGKIAGLQSVSPSGQPGSAQQIRIRGIGSINASSAPLF